VNDFHHAQDAYLNIVVGNVYYVKFTKDPLKFIRDEYERDTKKFNYNLSKMFDKDVVRGNDVAWRVESTIATVKEMLAKNTPILTRLNFVGHGEIANETLYGADKAKKDVYIPLKTNDPRMQDVTKYGGFTSATTAYFFLVEHGNEGKRIRTLETVPVYMRERLEKGREELQRYCEDSLGLINPSIRLPRIKLQSLIKKDGYYVHISGKTGNQITVRNAVCMCLRQNWIDYIRLLEKYQEKGELDKMVTAQKNLELYDILLDKHENSIYKYRPNAIGKKLKMARQKFENLDSGKQGIVLLQILQATQVGIAKSDLTLIGEAAMTGVMLFGKNITKSSECLLINQSVTGLYESSVNLLTV
jgi:CRISPR-associated endonuclease Csn1